MEGDQDDKTPFSRYAPMLENCALPIIKHRGEEAKKSGIDY